MGCKAIRSVALTVGAAALLFLITSAVAADESAVGPTRIRYVDGVPFLAKSTGELQVWVALRAADPLGTSPQDLRLTVVVVDGGATPVTFRPGKITAVAIVRGENGIERVPLKTRTAAEIDEPPGARAEWQLAIASMNSSGAVARAHVARPDVVTEGPGLDEDKASSSFARNRSVDPGSHFGGVVHLERKSDATAYLITVPFGGETFRFKFPAPKE